MWIHRGKFIECIAKQRTKIWSEMRRTRITASNNEKFLGFSKFGTRSDAIQECITPGKRKPINEAMQLGIDNEPKLRKEHEKNIGVDIKETNFCIGLSPVDMYVSWLPDYPPGSGDKRKLFELYPEGMKNPLHPNWFIGGSPDGEIELENGVKGILEVKYTKKLYWPLKYRLNCIKKYGRYPTPKKRVLELDGISGIDYFGHIWLSHYLQMQGCMGVMGKIFCDYVVGSGDSETYFERIPFDKSYWENFLYPNLVKIVETEIKPCMTKKDRIKFINSINSTGLI